MAPERIIDPDNVLCNVTARSKKHCLEILSELLSLRTAAIPADEIFSKLVERERLGSTGLGNGVGLPHCRLDGVDATQGALLKLSEAVEFDAPDGAPVDLVFGLMVPEQVTDRHREVLAEITALLSDAGVRSRLRAANSNSELYEAVHAGQRAERAGSRRRSALRGN
jgi:PTS system nitrogen regulatory IIA component